jgi:hypothetical protein
MIKQAFCDSFNRELLAMAPHRPEDFYKIALYSPAANLSALTTTYSAIDEVSENGDYIAGGQALVGFTVGLDGETAYLTWRTNPRWKQVTIAAAGALIYNATRQNRALAVLDFGGLITSTNAPFEVALPTPDAKTALIRIR